MTMPGWILVVAAALAPAHVNAQRLDSVRAHALAVAMAEDVRSLEHLSDLRFFQRGLAEIEAFFGIEFELPPNRDVREGDGRAHLTAIYRESGSEALLDEAARMDEESRYEWWKPFALETLARQEGPEAALEAARERDLLESDESRTVLRAVTVACARRDLEVCRDLDLPDSDHSSFAGTDVVNLTGSGAIERATRRLEPLRDTEPPLVVARWMAQGLEQMGVRCQMTDCDLIGLDSLATNWVEEILAVEAAAMAGQVERTATWNEQDDLTELRRALASFLSDRDLEATDAILDRMENADAIDHVLLRLIQVGPRIDLIRAVEIYLEHASEGSEPISVPYADLIRAGRSDLADRLIARASPTTATRARLDWAYQLTRAGRVAEAHEVMRTMVAGAVYEHPIGGARLLTVLENLRMLEEYLARVQALPSPIERLNGMQPLLAAWVQREKHRR